MPSPAFDPKRNFSSLFGEIARLLRRNFNRRLRHFGLTQTQWQAIAILRKREGINQASLAELLEIQPISLARLIDRLEAGGWVERRPDPYDRRAVQLFLTPKAEPIITELRDAAGAVHDDTCAGMSEAEFERLLAFLEQIKGNLLKADSASERTPQSTY